MKNGVSTRTNDNQVERWKRYVIAGNQSMMNKDFSTAGRQYEFARQCAESIFKKGSNTAESVSALVVTYHNIADLHRKKGDSASIKYYLEKVHSIILRALTSTPVNHHSHSSLLCGSKKTYSALVSYKKCGVYH